MKKTFDWKIWFGLAISAVFLYLSFSKVDFPQMVEAFSKANYWYLLPMVAVAFFSHFLRAWRWQFLLRPIGIVPTPRLLVALLIGYMANSFLPAHLGEFIRAYLVRRKEGISGSAVFGTIVIERIIDVFTLLLLMSLTLIVYPQLPQIARQGGYLTVAGVVVLLAILVVIKRYRSQSLRIFKSAIFFLPDATREKLLNIISSFLDGIVPLRSGVHYPVVALVSLLIWFCYGAIFQLAFYAFGFVGTYALPWTAALVLLVTTTIAVVVPSSPGYIGTYHFLCMLALRQFQVPDSQGLTYAFVVHGINFLPLIPVGLILISLQGLSLQHMRQKAVSQEI
ncbi:flippase-like domain-containing protein [candidate division KSB1 bacterium]|nr:flippase-like domain-containing protein [candidate division KSB1 bacterium]